MSQAGAFVRHQGIGRWWAAIPKAQWPHGDDFDNILRKYWVKHYGDRRQELVFIGLKDQMKQAKICKQLDACLVENYVENYLDSPETFKGLGDPFPKWFAQAS